ncbi:MAG: PhoH family protein [Spirochaetaceae bacterium]|nr:MAG: PhoH family protein [Spirochaetaceae bacterium]
MSDSTTLVLSDSVILQRICGANDRNIRYLGELFAAPVLVRGNEVILDSADPERQQRFLTLLEELQDQARQERDPDPGLIKALYQDLVRDNGASLEKMKRTCVEIPLAGTRVFPRSPRQAAVLESLQTKELSFLIGPAGTGKTYLAVAHALQELLSKRKRKLLLTRPVVEAGESLGFLPGDLAQKISPYLRPLYDAIEALLPTDIVRRLYDQNLIEIAPLAYMRGRSLRDCYVILDEAQNTTVEQMKMFLTRIGENTTAVVNGDVTQVDLPKRTRSGLLHAAGILRDIPEVGITRLGREDVVRSVLVQKIIRAYDEER